MKIDRLRAGIAGAAMILAAGAAHSQGFYEPRAGAIIPADFLCEDVGVVDVVNALMKDGSQESNERIIKETVDQSTCFLLGVPMPVKLVERAMSFTDASGVHLEVWSLEIPPELEVAILMMEEMATVVYVIIQVGRRDVAEDDNSSLLEMFLW